MGSPGGAGSGPILVVNAGSATLKVRVLDDRDRVTAHADLGPDADGGAVEEFLRSAGDLAASGHRVVHGGARFQASELVSDDVVAELDALSALAPLHNPPAVRWLRCLMELRPGLPAVACFDTAFHSGMPQSAAVYGIPKDWTQRLGVRRFGFHGLSHAYASRRAAELLGRPLRTLRTVTCHLGAGASLAGVDGGRSVDTTMGFTPLEGLIMATRSGSVDPGALLWLQDRLGLSPDEMHDHLERRSGLLGVSGISGDLRLVLAAAREGHADARLAVDTYVHRIRTSLGAMAAATGGLDAVVFTGGVGEGSAEIRAAVCRGLGFLGIVLDAARNEAATSDEDISAGAAQVRVLRVGAREDLEIAAEVRRVVGAAASASRESDGASAVGDGPLQ
jgi:acetate kinase